MNWYSSFLMPLWSCYCYRMCQKGVAELFSWSFLLWTDCRSHHRVQWHFGFGIHKQAGKVVLVTPVPSCQTGSNIGRVIFCDPDNPLHLRSSECGGGPTRSSGSSKGTVWCLHPLVVGRVFQVWGALTVDLFASALKKKLLVYCSLLLYLMAWLEDSFWVILDSLDAYAFPPFSVICMVNSLLMMSQCLKMTIIAPF